MYQPVTEEIPPDEYLPESPDLLGGGEEGLGRGTERDDLPEADHSAVDADDPGVEFSGAALAGQPSRTAGSTGSAHHQHHHQQPQQPNRIHLQWEPHYLTTLPGIMKIVQLIVTLTALICATSIHYQGNDYLSLPSPWKFRVFVFTSVFSLLSCVGIIFCRATNVARLLLLDWLLLDIILSSILSLLYFLSSCMIASASAYYNTTFIADDWTSRNKLVAGVVLGYTCSLLYFAHILGIHVRFKRRAQFRHQLLQVDSGSIDSMQPQV